MPGRRLEILPVTSFTAAGTYGSELRFAVPTGRAKSGLVAVNMFGMTGSGSVTVQVFTATDPQLDPNAGSPGATPAFWIAAHTTAIPFTIATPELGTKAAPLTTVLDWLRIVVTVPASSTCRVGAVAFLYDA